MKFAPTLYFDCDGVLADFNRHARLVLGMDPDEFEARYGSKVFWTELQRAGEFFFDLPLMPDAMVLFNAMRHVKPIILTGTPGGNWAPQQKVRWAARYFPGTKIITCSAKDKIRHIEDAGDVLVDDKTKFRDIWIKGDGIFVHHTSALDSIAQLKELVPIWFQHTDRWTPPKGL